ncbi:cyclohexanone monooxygenase [Lentinula edodes]|uniref:Cyclohexanone monooxygenase n=1 Tax=Lentinula lateritia TaxID=40482 RepID=A0A9W9B530_9AGAR|nr:cyclohexanone monooxygenase [Lentinula edodes]
MSGQTPASFDRIDALVVGAGFAGLYQLYRLRALGLSVKIFEAASGIGGTWHMNRYPGVRTDCEAVIYQYDLEEVWKDWTWKDKYPSGEEIQAYFRYVDHKLDLKRDIYFNTRVMGAKWDETSHLWNVSIASGLFVRARFLILCTGSLSKPLIPNIKDLSTFEGRCFHSSHWPQEGLDLAGKHVAVIGTGSSGIQVIENIASQVRHLTVFQRTPNLALPINQSRFDEKEQVKMKETDFYNHIFRRLPQTFAGFLYEFQPIPFTSATTEAQRLLWESQWKAGGFHFWLGNYPDIFSDETVNREAYAFWRSKVRARIRNPALHEKLAPIIPPHPFGIKQPGLEQGYFEVFDRENVSLVDVRETPIERVTPKGLVVRGGTIHTFDILVLATGFDSFTGAIVNLDIRGCNDVSIGEKWKNGVFTNIGMTTSDFPNLFFVYGPQAPSVLANSTSVIPRQSDWITDCLKFLQDNDYTRIETKRDSEQAWRDLVLEIASKRLWHKCESSWYTGSNLASTNTRPVEMLAFSGGLPLYLEKCAEAADNGYQGFELS